MAVPRAAVASVRPFELEEVCFGMMYLANLLTCRMVAPLGKVETARIVRLSAGFRCLIADVCSLCHRALRGLNPASATP